MTRIQTAFRLTPSGRPAPEATQHHRKAANRRRPLTHLKDTDVPSPTPFIAVMLAFLVLFAVVFLIVAIRSPRCGDCPVCQSGDGKFTGTVTGTSLRDMKDVDVNCFCCDSCGAQWRE